MHARVRDLNNLLILHQIINIDVPRPQTNNLWVFLFQTIDSISVE